MVVGRNPVQTQLEQSHVMFTGSQCKHQVGKVKLSEVR